MDQNSEPMVICIYIPHTQLVVPNPNCSSYEICKICKRPFRFSNLDMHIEAGCAAALLREYEEKMREQELKSEEEEVNKKTSSPGKRGRGRPRKNAQAVRRSPVKEPSNSESQDENEGC